jgi:hypothetical protein
MRTARGCCQRPNHVWSYDFVAARTSDGSSLRSAVTSNGGAATVGIHQYAALFERHTTNNAEPPFRRPPITIRQADPGLHGGLRADCWS